MPRPIFIIGSPRSGTSVLTWAIGQHPNISLHPESNWMAMLAKPAFEAFRVGSSREGFTQISNAQMPFEAFAAHIGNAIDAISRDCFERRIELFIPGFRDREEAPEGWSDPANGPRLIHHPKDPKQRWVDGTPEYTNSAYELGMLFPDCQFIHILRRPDQVVNSLAHFENAGSHGQNMKLATGLDIWMKNTLAAQEAAQLFGAKRLLRIDNALMASDGEEFLKRCFDFLGEEASERGLLALQAKMNSSKADDKQPKTASDIANLPGFKSAMELYETLRDTPVADEPDATVIASARERFEKPPGVVQVLKKAIGR